MQDNDLAHFWDLMCGGRGAVCIWGYPLITSSYFNIKQGRQKQETKIILPCLIGLRDALQFSPYEEITFNGFSSVDENIVLPCTAGQPPSVRIITTHQEMWGCFAVGCRSLALWQKRTGRINYKFAWLKTTKEVTYTSLAALIQWIEQKPSPSTYGWMEMYENRPRLAQIAAIHQHSDSSRSPCSLLPDSKDVK